MGYQPANSDSITDPNVAYIRSDGNDTTGDGSPSAPYLTAQKAAVTEGFTRLNIGVVNAGNITWSNNTARTLYIQGVGDGSVIGTIGTDGGNLTVIDTGCQSVAITGVSTSSPTEGVNSGNVTVRNISVTSLTSQASTSTASGTPGGDGGNIDIQGICSIGTVTANGGNNDDGGNGGNAGNVTIDGPSIVTVSVALTGGTGGTPGSDGVLTVRQSGSIPTPSPDAATVVGAIINNVFYATTYP